MKQIGALLVERSEIGAKDGAKDGEVIETGLGAEAAGDFLLHLGHAHGLLGDIV